MSRCNIVEVSMDGTKFHLTGILGNGPADLDNIKRDRKTSCPDDSTFAGYMDNMLTDKEQGTVEKHFSECPTCRNNFYELRAMLDADQSATPDALADSVKKNLEGLSGNVASLGRKVKV